MRKLRVISDEEIIMKFWQSMKIQTEAAIDGMPDNDDINISDVIEVIETTDPEFSSSNQNNMRSMTNSGGNPTGSHSNSSRRNVYVEIVEQPASKAMRFRYECEGRSAGSIPGSNSTSDNKTFPTIRVCNYRGKAVVVVSCVTKDAPYRPHPHNLVGKEGCRRGVCTVEIPVDTMTVTFSNLGIRCVKKKDIEEALKVREEIRVDPFRTGFSHRSQPSSIDLNAVRLCFQVFLEGESGKFTYPVPPVVSEPIFDKKAMSDLAIFQLSDDSSSVAGGRKILLFCEKVTKEDIQVRFFEEKDGQVKWEGFADFQPADVHRQVGIAFRTPRYHTLEVTEPVKVLIQLLRPSDKACSEPLPFILTPLEKEADMKRKRQRFGSESPNNYIRVSNLQNQAVNNNSNPHGQYNPLMNMPMESSVKIEPREIPAQSNKTFGGSLSPMYSPGANIDTMQYRIPPSISPGKSPSPMDLPADNMYVPPPQYQLQNVMSMHSPSSSPIQKPLDPIHLAPHNPIWNIPQSAPHNQPFHSPTEQWNIPPEAAQPPISYAEWNGNSHPSPTNFEVGNLIDTNNYTAPTPVTCPMNSFDNPPAGLSSVLDLDSQELTQLNSAEIAAGLNVFDHQLSENLSNNLSLSDARVNPANHPPNNDEPTENMTDSFTRLTNSTINEICNLNAMLKK